MPKSKAFIKKKRNITLTLLASFFIVLSIPMVIWGITNISSLDTRAEAADTSSKCSIRFLYVDANYLEINKIVSLDSTINAESNIKQVKIWANSGTSTTFAADSIVLLDKSYTGTLKQAYEKYQFTPTKLGAYTISGTLTTEGPAYGCQQAGGINATARVIAKNEEPKFTSSIPLVDKNILLIGDQYNYTITAEDTDSTSGFGYYYSFTPNATWLTPKITKSTQGNGTKLQINLQGIADYPASYLVSAFIWDGYNGHTKSQSWVINVDQKSNDIPVVTVSLPKDGTVYEKGSKITTEWSVKDFNAITKYKVFLSTNPGNQSSWILLDDNVKPTINKYVFDSSGSTLTEGEYYFIIQATDNQTPSATGNGLSGKFIYGKTSNDDGSDDGIQVKEAQVLNISPSDKSTIKNKRTIVRATLVAGENATLKMETLKVLFNGKDLTSQFKISEISDSKADIVLTPTEDFPEGSNKVSVSFEDSLGNVVSKEWTFTVEKEETATINIFGTEIETAKLLTWGLIGLGILILVIVVPWLFYVAFSNNKKEEYEIYPTYTPQKTTGPTNNGATYADYYGSTNTTTTQPATTDYKSMGYTQSYIDKNIPVNTTPIQSTTLTSSRTTTQPQNNFDTSPSLTPIPLPIPVPVETTTQTSTIESTTPVEGVAVDTTQYPWTSPVSSVIEQPVQQEIIQEPVKPVEVSTLETPQTHIDPMEYYASLMTPLVSEPPAPTPIPVETSQQNSLPQTVETIPAVVETSPSSTTGTVETVTPSQDLSVDTTKYPWTIPVSASTDAALEQPVNQAYDLTTNTALPVTPAIETIETPEFNPEPVLPMTLATPEETKTFTSDSFGTQNQTPVATPYTFSDTTITEPTVLSSTPVNEQILTPTVVSNSLPETDISEENTLSTNLTDSLSVMPEINASLPYQQIQSDATPVVNPIDYYAQFTNPTPVKANILEPTSTPQPVLESMQQAQSTTIPTPNVAEINDTEDEIDSGFDSLTQLAEDFEKQQNEEQDIYDEAAEQALEENTLQASNPSVTQSAAATPTTTEPTIPEPPKSEETLEAQKLGYTSPNPTVQEMLKQNIFPTPINDEKSKMEDTAPPPTTIFK